ncbi:hypothetical protein DACRYDRAFT_49925 [Dacryopinax primogenitus]|uniref:Uncharacterized protein n=1 Tax=Dacryopinax primogenitus (strain DJM 731) TaxID=1858805 RepID=M5GCK2_DACPD|nr:uncharacterized protein DACRYDRAFT_49925 [Dacryopinax primogenitus]EJU03927.1 hypothetical protein DACRYDRAFT_49925 [Dacryopinax primogenitus]
MVALTGLRVDYSRLVVLYNEKYKSLVNLRRNASSRLQHRLLNISMVDVKLFREELQSVLLRPSEDTGSGIDWPALMGHVIASHADRLSFLQHILHALDRHTDMGQREYHDVPRLISDVRQQIMTMLAPCISRASFSGMNGTKLNDTWFEATMERCSTRYTSHLPVDRLSSQELVLKTAVEETMHEICRTLLIVWRTAYSAEAIIPSYEQVALVETWMVEIDRLIMRLDWVEWQRCDPPCSPDHYCSLPQWPLDGINDGTEDVFPHCISRIHYHPLTDIRSVFPSSAIH